MFYKWMLLFIYTLPAYGLEYSQIERSKLKEAKISDFKLRLHKKLEEVNSLRLALIEGSLKLVPSVSSHLVDFESKETISKGCIALVDGSDTVFVVTSKNVLSILQNATFVPIYRFRTYRDFISLQAVENRKAVWLLVQQTSKKNRHFVDMYEFDNQTLRLGQRIDVPSPSLVSTAKYGQELYIAIVSKYDIFHEFRLYHLIGTQLDEIFWTQMEITCSGVAIWNIEGIIYIALSFSKIGKLQIRQFREDSEEMKNIQLLDIYAYVIKGFEDDHSHYLVCGTQNSVVIYWWTGYTFQPLHSKSFNKKIVDIATHRFAGKTFIAVIFQHEVEFLVQDGSARYVAAGNQSFDLSTNLKSVLLWKSGANLYMLPLFEEKYLASIYEIRLKFEVSDPEKELLLDGCMNLLEDQMNKREKKMNEISSKLENVWSSSSTVQVPSLTVRGKVRSRKNSSIRSLNLGTNVSSIVTLEEMNDKLQNCVLDRQTELTKSVLKSTEQHIQSNLHFTNLNVTHGKVGGLLNDVNINKVATSRLHYALRKTGKQIITSNMTVDRATCGTLTTGFLNGNKLEDYVLLRPGSWNMTGDVTFKSVKSSEVLVKSTINDVDITDIVLTSSTQNIWDQKTFEIFTAKSILIPEENVGEINFSKMKEMAYWGSKNFSGQNFRFTPTLNIDGNLSIYFLNGKEIDYLYSNSVKRNVQGNIHGLKTFKSVVVKGNVNVLKRINSFNLTNLMTVNTDQYITGFFNFSNTIHSQDVLTDSVNELDLSSEAVFRSRLNTEIRGIKTFKENMNVHNITMKEGCQIDFFDPSTEFSEVMFHAEENDIFGRTHWFRKGVTVKNMKASNVDVNANFPYLKKLQNVWLRTTEQTIPRLEVKNIKVKKLNVSRVNGIAVEDLVTIKGEDSINSRINFTGDVSIQTFTPRKEANVNYPPGFWNPDVKVYISGNVTIEDPVLEGDLTVTGAINNIEMDFMHAKTMQTVKGEINFEEIKLNELSSTNLNAGLLNGTNITEYYQRSVLLSKDIPIFNKNFTLLKGRAMECFGTLNKVDIDRIVTTNTNQTLFSSYKFQMPQMYFEKVDVKKFFGTLQLENVIYKDLTGKISNKYFKGTVNTFDLTTSGNISGVNITLLKLQAFNKSDNNNVEEKMTILANLTAKEIQVSNNRSIDNVFVENLIRLDKSTSLGYFYAPSIKAENVNVSGKVNGCPLNLESNVLSRKRGNQNVNSKVHVKSLEIHGNLTVDYLNGAKIPYWLIFFKEMATPEVHGSVILENVETNSISILNTVNDISIEFLLHDYVQKNNFQLIKGKKVFKHIGAESVTADVLISNETCGIDLSEIYELAISRRSGNQTIMQSDLTLTGLEAKRLTIYGKLNDLKFPEDVVLTNTTEVIEGEVRFSSLNASAGLNVTGRIGEVGLENFLDERVSLSAYEEISSNLTFEDESFIEDHCSIRGEINQINLKDVVNKFKNQTIAGAKKFKEEIRVMADVTVRGPVNHVSLDHLRNNLFLYDRNETLKEVVNFSNLSASSLTCGTINGLQIVNAYKNFHTLVHDINDKLDDVTDHIQSHQELLRKQSDSVEDPLSLYSFFELHSVLDFGLIERFLPVYEYGTLGPKYDLQVTQMIMWVKDDDPCRKTKLLIADVTKDGTFTKDGTKMNGKVFPFTLSAEKDNVVGFYVQAEHIRRCSTGKKTRINVITLYASGETERKTILTPVNATVLDVELLEFVDIFLILSYSNAGTSERIFVYQYDTENSTWTRHQKFHFQDMTSISIISLGRDTDLLHDTKSVYLSVTGRTSPGITVYEWDINFDEFVLKTNISTSVSSHAIWVVNDRTFYLLLAKEMDKVWKGNNTKVDIFTEPLEVYTLDDELQLNHTVNVKGVNSLEIFGLADESFVLASSNHFDTVYVLQYRGYNGFELIQEIPSPSVTETRVFTVDNHLYVAVSSRKGPSKILKASIRGGRHLID